MKLYYDILEFTNQNFLLNIFLKSLFEKSTPFQPLLNAYFGAFSDMLSWGHKGLILMPRYLKMHLNQISLCVINGVLEWKYFQPSYFQFSEITVTWQPIISRHLHRSDFLSILIENIFQICFHLPPEQRRAPEKNRHRPHRSWVQCSAESPSPLSPTTGHHGRARHHKTSKLSENKVFPHQVVQQ